MPMIRKIGVTASERRAALGGSLHRTGLSLLLLGLASVPHSAAARPAAQRCTAANATATTIEAIRVNDHAWLGRCVRISGIHFQARLYADRKALIEPWSLYGEKTRHSLVLYRGALSRRRGKPAMVEVIGKVGSCAAQNDALSSYEAEHPGEIVMIGGYCHTSLETYVEPDTIAALSGMPIPRLTESEVPVADRPLVEPPAALTVNPAHLAAATALAAALAGNDEATFRRLTQPDLADWPTDKGNAPPPDWVRNEIRESHAAYAKAASLRRTFAAMMPLDERQRRLFVRREDLPTASATSAAIDSIIQCWCTTRDCNGRWPVSEIDIGGDDERPYRCIETRDYVLGLEHRTVATANVITGTGGFTEPARH